MSPEPSAIFSLGPEAANLDPQGQSLNPKVTIIPKGLNPILKPEILEYEPREQLT